MIGRLRGRSSAELRDRLLQAVRARVERVGVLPRVSVPAHVAADPMTPWPAPDGSAIRARLSADATAALLARADRIVAGSFDVLGLQGLSYGTPVNWQLDPLSGRSAAPVHWSRVPYLDHDIVGDHKVTWEVNRHQWFITLGQAWVLTRDPRYDAAAARLLSSWLDSNQAKNGINWCSALELAFRVMSWVHGLRLMADAPALTPALRRRLLESAAVQVDHIERNISTWFSPNTHLTGEALAIMIAGCAWPGLPEAARWREDGWRILCEQAPIQFRADGVYFEQSPWYQSYTVDFYVLGTTWARLAGLPVPDDVLALTRRGGKALRAVTRPDGTIVRFGDDDGGRTLPLTTAAFGDMTDSLWRASWLLDAPELLPPRTAGRDALLWLEGPAAFDAISLRQPAPDGRASRIFRQGGWCLLSEPANSAERDHWLVLDAGPHGALSSAHSHADALSLDLTVHGTPILVDAGTGAYVGPLRRVYRSTAVHNTVTVDGADSSEQGTSFNWRSATDAVCDGFGMAQGASFVSAHHDGYRRLADPVRHHRTILRLHRHYWLMLDTLDAQSTHEASLTLQCAPQVQIAPMGAQCYAMTAGGTDRTVTLQVALDSRLRPTVESRRVSPAYALELPADALVAAGRIEGTTTLCTVFGASDEAAPAAVERVGHEDVWRVTHAHGEDLVARPSASGTVLGPARFDGRALALLGADTPHTLVAAGAGTLHLAGRTYTLAGDEIRLARRAPDGSWTMES